MKICIDPGHGGKAPGAVGLYGSKEKDIVLDVAFRLRDILRKKGHTVIMTRSSDTSLGLTARGIISNKARADAFVSIHCNAAGNRSAHGFEIYTTKGETGADPLATKIYEAWHTAFPSHRLRSDWSDQDPDKEANFTVLCSARAPAVLIELDFISNPPMEAWLVDKANHIRMAEAIAEGIYLWGKGGGYNGG